MGFRFQRRIKILPGVTLNLSKSGISTSVGRRGAKVTLGKDGVRTTVGLPGTGLSYTTYQRYNNKTKGKVPGRGYVSTCPYCGHNMRKQWDNCPKCGQSLTEAVKVPQPVTPPPREKSSKSWLLCLLLIIAVLLVLLLLK